MKRFATVSFVLLLVLTTTAVFAAGQSENSTLGRGYRQGFASNPWDDAQLITVTGKLSLADTTNPELVNGNDVYELMVPRYYLYTADVVDGQTITVEGYLLPEGYQPRFADASTGSFLHVTKATIDGQTYELDDFGPMGMMYDNRASNRRGGRGGMPMGGRRF